MALITIHVVPSARRSEIVGEHADAVRVRIAAPPRGGAANEELVRFLAQRLGVGRRDVTITAGHASRRKRVAIAGLDSGDVRQRLLRR